MPIRPDQRRRRIDKNGQRGSLEALYGGVRDRRPNFLQGILSQIVKCSPGLDEEEIGFMISVIKQEKPSKHVDMMLVIQMAANHKAIMRYAAELALTSDLRLLDTVGRVVDKLMRTYVLQRDLLMRRQAGAAAADGRGAKCFGQ